MKHSEILNQFREELATLSREVETSVAMGHFDINKICEDVFCAIFKELYGFGSLRNLNDKERQNYPGIDLADDHARVAIQVTSDKSLDKIKDGLQKIIKHDLHVKYDRVIFYILTRKQSSYSADSLRKACDNKLAFDSSTDVLDFTDLATKAASASPRTLKNALDILGAYKRGCEVGLAPQDFDPPLEPPELLTANLLEIYFPSTLYIAELVPEVLGSKKVKSQRKAVGAYVRSQERTVPSDYEVSGRRLITFHNLQESDNPFAFLVDEGTVEPFSPRDFYSIDDDHERIFKSLLRFSLQHKLYRHRILWKHEEGLFIFLPIRDADDVRTEAWIGQKKSRRTVFQRKYKNKEPSKVLSTRHFAFSVGFLIIDKEWYISVTPDWFFSFGEEWRRSAYADKPLSGLKRMEKNRSVFDQFRFVCSWLKNLDAEDLFSFDAASSPMLSFGNVLSLNGAPHLNEELWEPLVVVDDDDFEQVKLGLR